MKWLASFAALLVSIAGGAQIIQGELQDCSPVDIEQYASVDYFGPSNTWWDTSTGRVVGHSVTEDSEILPVGCES